MNHESHGPRPVSELSERITTNLLELIGQGAQWASMGAHLIRSSEFVRQRILDLENSLATLPAADRPEWSLTEQILAGKETSRLSEAAFSQPLCTAIQVALVDLLRTAGITFTTVVGHSSGEISAAVRIFLSPFPVIITYSMVPNIGMQ